MATQRAPFGVLQRINITINGQPNLPGINMAPGDTLEFFNGSSAPVSIQFICANGPVFNDIPRINQNTPSPTQTPQKNQITTDYMITNLNTGFSQGPYSIEVGINHQTVPAPMLIPVSGGKPDPNEATISIPIGGWVQFDLIDGGYNINWTPAGVFPSGTFPKGMTNAAKAQTGNQNMDAAYSVDGPRGLTGTGTVKIRS